MVSVVENSMMDLLQRRFPLAGLMKSSPAPEGKGSRAVPATQSMRVALGWGRWAAQAKGRARAALGCRVGTRRSEEPRGLRREERPNSLTSILPHCIAFPPWWGYPSSALQPLHVSVRLGWKDEGSQTAGWRGHCCSISLPASDLQVFSFPWPGRKRASTALHPQE